MKSLIIALVVLCFACKSNTSDISKTENVKTSIDSLPITKLSYSFYYGDENQSIITKNDYQFFENNENYFITDIDINQDNIKDKVVSSVKYQGNELYFFKKNNNKYELVLKSVNFSEDGGFIIKNISSATQNDEILKIHLYFPDGGNFQETQYISFQKPDNWLLKRTVYETTIMKDSPITYLCDVFQNINMEEFNSNIGFQKFKHIPEANERDKECSVKK